MTPPLSTPADSRSSLFESDINVPVPFFRCKVFLRKNCYIPALLDPGGDPPPHYVALSSLGYLNFRAWNSVLPPTSEFPILHKLPEYISHSQGFEQRV